MSLWQFSESSQSLLSRCIDLATVEGNNKWIQKFGSKSGHLSKTEEITDTIIVNHPNNISSGDIACTNGPIEAMVIDESSSFTPVRVKVEKDDFCREILDLEPVTHFDYIVEKSLENPNSYLILARKLPVASIEKLCKHIYGTKNVNSNFLENFYTVFFPEFLKREPNRLTLDLLIMSKCYSIFYNKLLVIIFKDVELPNNILHYFAFTLNTKEQTDLLMMLCHSDIPKEAFIYHLTTIYIIYKNSQKSINLQNYILAKLKEISLNCVSDKNYGRFLLNFLQSHRDYRTNITDIENMVDTHRTAFKNPCFNILNEIKNVSTNQSVNLA